jgi:hypothetical protein
LPLSVVVAVGEPGVPVICWASADEATNIVAAVSNEQGSWLMRFMF